MITLLHLKARALSARDLFAFAFYRYYSLKRISSYTLNNVKVRNNGDEL